MTRKQVIQTLQQRWMSRTQKEKDDLFELKVSTDELRISQLITKYKNI